MQVLKDEIKLNILKAAKDLFLQKGFERASMNMIAKKTGVSKSNLYNYFSSKEELFYHLTGEAYAEMEVMLENIFKHESGEHFDVKEFKAQTSKELIGLLTKYKEEILLIVDCSKGTRFENTKHEFINRLQEHSMAEFKKFNINMENDDSFFAHYVATTLVEGLLEIIRHNKSDSWIKNNVKMLVGYYINGYTYFFADSFS